jgi:serine/threonine-protein kinase
MIGSVLGHYRIVEKLGAGGMGEVYLARDERLGRDVAMKVLPAELLADESARRRFHREARALSQFNHPHIATAYDFDSQDGVDFLVMEYVAGEPLDRKLRRGPLTAEECAVLLRQLAEGLSAAHARGIIHRDLKPGNLILTPDGRLKILDFGLATLRQRNADETTVTITRSVVGTLPYMAPEQLRGETVDYRADIYSAGAVGYEMITGRQPFRGPTAAEMTGAILRDAPRPPSELEANVPAALEAVVLRCLAKAPEQRYQSAPELAAALEPAVAEQPKRRRPRWIVAAVVTLLLAAAVYIGPRTATDQKTSVAPVAIAALPFKLLNPDPSTSYLGVGIPDALITRLANIRQVRVRPTAAVLNYEGVEVDAREAGRTLGCDYLLTGTLQKADDRYRVNVQLLRAGDGLALWGKSFDPARSDLLDLQDALAEDVVTALRVQLTAAERERVYRRYTENSAAYELYLKGRSLLPRDELAAVRLFDEALRLDYKYALAHAGKAMACAMYRISEAQPADNPKWENCAAVEAKRALGLDPDLAEAHEAMASVYRWSDFDWEGTIRECDRALELNPSLHLPHRLRADAFRHLGLLDLVEREIRSARENNPAGPDDSQLLASALVLDGRFADALQMSQTPEGIRRNYYEAQALFHTGRAEAGIAMLAGLSGPSIGGRRVDALRAAFLAATGKHDEARRLLAVLVSLDYRDHHTAYGIGSAYAQLREPAAAVSWLRRAAEWGFVCYPWYVYDPLLDPLRSDAEFRRLTGELETAWEANKARLGSTLAIRHGRDARRRQKTDSSTANT